jgi:integrase/recombinase XerD
MTPNLDKLIQGFFCCRLIDQQGVSQHTVESYRDTFRLLLAYLPQHLHKEMRDLVLADLDAPTVLAFLDYLQAERGNSARTRNSRLAALRSFVRYAASRDPTAWPLANRVLAIPAKRHARLLLGYLTRPEMEAVLSAPDAKTWSGQRDRVLFAVMYNSGARVSEVVGLRRNDVNTGPDGRSLCIRGKGRKERVVPLWKQTVAVLIDWMKRLPAAADAPVFPNRNGKPLSRSGVEDRLEEAVKKARQSCPGLRNKNVSPHTIRHTTAMHLLQAGVDLTVIALWLGHESPETTHQYVEADLKMKEEALRKAEGVPVGEFRYQPKPEVLEFLDNL